MNPEDSELAQFFREMREQDSSLAKPFDLVWPKAQRRAWNRLRAGMAIAALGIAVVVIAGIGVSVRKRPANSTPQPAALSEWHSPTDVLLAGSYSEMLRTAPRLGETFFEMKGSEK